MKFADKGKITPRQDVTPSTETSLPQAILSSFVHMRTALLVLLVLSYLLSPIPPIAPPMLSATPDLKHSLFIYSKNVDGNIIVVCREVVKNSRGAVVRATEWLGKPPKEVLQRVGMTAAAFEIYYAQAVAAAKAGSSFSIVLRGGAYAALWTILAVEVAVFSKLCWDAGQACAEWQIAKKEGEALEEIRRQQIIQTRASADLEETKSVIESAIKLHRAEITMFTEVVSRQNRALAEIDDLNAEIDQIYAQILNLRQQQRDGDAVDLNSLKTLYREKAIKEAKVKARYRYIKRLSDLLDSPPSSSDSSSATSSSSDSSLNDSEGNSCAPAVIDDYSHLDFVEDDPVQPADPGFDIDSITSADELFERPVDADGEEYLSKMEVEQLRYAEVLVEQNLLPTIEESYTAIIDGGISVVVPEIEEVIAEFGLPDEFGTSDEFYDALACACEGEGKEYGAYDRLSLASSDYSSMFVDEDHTYAGLEVGVLDIGFDVSDFIYMEPEVALELDPSFFRYQECLYCEALKYFPERFEEFSDQFSCETPTPTPSPSPTVTVSPTATPWPTPTVSPTVTPWPTPTVTVSPTVTPSPIYF